MAVLHNLQKEIGGGQLLIKCGTEDMGWGIRNYMHVVFPDFMTEEKMVNERFLYSQIMHYTANKFHLAQLKNGNELAQYMQENNFTQLDETQVVKLEEYAEDKSAMLRVFIPSKTSTKCIENMEIVPCVTIEAMNPFGFTVLPGSMSDFSIHKSTTGQLIGTTKDFMKMHFGFVSLFITQLVENIYMIAEQKQIPDDFQRFAQYHFLIKDQEVRAIKEEIRQYLLEKVNVNKNKHIDKIEVDGQSIDDKLRMFQISKFIIPHNFLLNMGLLFGKRPSAVNRYIEKALK